MVHKKIMFASMLVFSLFLVANAMGCTDVTEGMFLTGDTTLCGGTYYFNNTNVMTLSGNDFTLDCNETYMIGNGVTWNGTGYNSTGDLDQTFGILLYATTNVTVKNCHIANFWIDIFLYNATSDLITDNEVSGAYVGLWGDAPVTNDVPVGVFNTVIENNYAHDNLVGIGMGQGNATLGTNTYNNTFRNNQVINNDRGIILGGDFTDNPIETSDIIITGNNFTTADRSSLSLDIGDTGITTQTMMGFRNSTRITICNNTGIGNHTMTFFGVGDVTNVDICDNTFIAENGYLYWTNGTIENVTVSGNNVTLNSSNSTYDGFSPILINVDALGFPPTPPTTTTTTSTSTTTTTVPTTTTTVPTCTGTLCTTMEDIGAGLGSLFTGFASPLMLFIILLAIGGMVGMILSSLAKRMGK